MSVGFFQYLTRRQDHSVALYDCDYQYPLADSLLKVWLKEEGKVTVRLPVINRNQCILCKACARACAFHAIRIEPAISYITLDEERCRACHACLNTCRYDAIREKPGEIGQWRKYQWKENALVFEGTLQAEEFFAIRFIQQLKALPFSGRYKLVVAYSGMSYSALESIHNTDILIVVIDPAFFDTRYFDWILRLLKKNDHHPYVILNRCEVVNNELISWLFNNNLDILAEIPEVRLPGGMEQNAEYPAFLPDGHIGLEACFSSLYQFVEKVTIIPG